MKNETLQSKILKAIGADPNQFKAGDTIKHKMVVDTEQREIDYQTSSYAKGVQNSQYIGLDNTQRNIENWVKMKNTRIARDAQKAMASQKSWSHKKDDEEEKGDIISGSSVTFYKSVDVNKLNR